ncbi:MAG: hypothetical protein U9N55_09245 [candidate division Zixibacteria bacterium]|nr:hypothetical protein [candidate division Zixibacteria bacterium]
MNKVLLFLAVVSIGASLFASTPNRAQRGPRTVMVWVNDYPTPWGESQIEDLLIRSFSRTGHLRAFPINTNANQMTNFPRDWFNADSLADWTAKKKSRFVLVVDVLNERLERRKGFHLPMVFHKYQTVGIIEADVRLFDARLGRFIMSESLKVEEGGPKIFQFTMDDDINDPDLHLTTPKKLSFIAHLEKKFCHRIIERLGEEILLR